MIILETSNSGLAELVSRLVNEHYGITSDFDYIGPHSNTLQVKVRSFGPIPNTTESLILCQVRAFAHGVVAGRLSQ